MALQLVVATTEATDPTRNCGPFRTTANVSDYSSKRVCGEARGVTEEVRVGEIVHQFSPRLGTPLSLDLGSVSLGEGGMHDGKEEGC